ncbi:MAG: hypothetical protein HKO53_16955 [Gemmatimonadetes bacterium]|nr:hypothetical protein [Gemmatimonadota bacterium]NNM34768.1 hypothetical protein [Gemmatimonadota bacterium]
MPRFMMGALALTSACLGYLLATRWDEGAKGHAESAEHQARADVSLRSALPSVRRDPPGPGSGYGDYPLGV